MAGDSGSLHRTVVIALLLGILGISGVFGDVVGGRIRLETDELQKSVQLNGEWEFIRDTFLAPGGQSSDKSHVLIQVPSTWKAAGNSQATPSRYGFGTYRLTIEIPVARDIALRLPPLDSAYRVYWNGDYIGSNGKVAAVPEDTYVYEYSPLLFRETAIAGENILIIHMANFAFPRGGVDEPVIIGDPDYLSLKSRGTTALDLLLVGVLLAMAVYHAAVYAFCTSDKAPLYLAILCTIIAVRVLVTGDGFLYRISDLSWSWGSRIEYSMWYTSLALLPLYARSLYRHFANKSIGIGLTFVGTFMAAMSLFATVRLTTSLVYVADAITVLVIVYCLSAVIRAAAGGDRAAYFTLIGAIFFAIAAMNDVLYALNIIDTRFLVHVGLTVFTMSQALLLARRFSLAFGEVEHLGEKLGMMNTQLEEKVHERTSRLERAYTEIRELSELDPLTGCYNRRYLETTLLDELIKAFRYGRTISVVMCDLDDFKRINDDYGHGFGDETLKEFVILADKVVRERIDWVARYGGEEFVVVLPETDKNGASALAERLRVALASSKLESNHEEVRVTASFGVATLYPEATPDTAQVNQLLHAADMQLYRAKQGGKNRVEADGDT